MKSQHLPLANKAPHDRTSALFSLHFPCHTLCSSHVDLPGNLELTILFPSSGPSHLQFSLPKMFFPDLLEAWLTCSLTLDCILNVTPSKRSSFIMAPYPTAAHSTLYAALSFPQCFYLFEMISFISKVVLLAIRFSVDSFSSFSTLNMLSHSLLTSTVPDYKLAVNHSWVSLY